VVIFYKMTERVFGDGTICTITNEFWGSLGKFPQKLNDL
jgi:hypothetical protein